MIAPINREIKVAQLAGYVSEHSGYHHGEQSLTGGIIGMAQEFTGSNNISTLVPKGQFDAPLHWGLREQRSCLWGAGKSRGRRARRGVTMSTRGSLRVSFPV